MSLSAKKAVRSTAILAAVAVSAGLALTSPMAASAQPTTAAPSVTPPTVKRVTLITGDVVEVSTGADGKQSVVILPRPDGSIPQAAINRVGGHLYVVPTEAFGLLGAQRLDRGLFDVTSLIKAKYDDASRSTLPVMIDYGKGAAAAAESRSASLQDAQRTVTIPQLGIAAFHADKDDARAFWKDLTIGADAAGNPTGLADGAVQVDLDGKVKATLEHSVPHIHAPEAWQAGFDGTGSTVAVLDTGYDPTHPDLAGRVVASHNFTTDDSVVDGNGHGTHVLSTVGGTGAASEGLRKGVAPGADLMVGKVLSSGGWGEDSWVLAGMVWAVDQGADVVSMSLGGYDPDDGTSPLAQAVNELSASSDSLFVIAAGNNGWNGPSTISSPGSAEAALTVGATDNNDVMAPFSSRGPRLNNGGLKPEVVAPGVDITAARAAGTSAGSPVDQYYTTLSGTSMATPHVAGVAAMVKQKHPNWDGEQIKEAIANSTVAVADATGFDAGTGRVDALTAVNQDLLAPASLSLGTYKWPYSDLDPSSTALTYTNTGDTDVTLTLALTAQDGSPEPTGAMTLSDNQVTVPAGATSSVDVVLDPTVAESGAYSAVVTATPDTGAGTVRTGLAYLLEDEAYDVKVTVVPRTGSQSVSHQLTLSGYGDPWIYQQRNFDASPDTQTATFRLPPGTYATSAISAGLGADGAKEGIVTYNPTFTVSKDTEIVLDENDTAQFDYNVTRPVVNDGGILSVSWLGEAGYTEFTYYGAADRLYARPSADITGPADHPTLAANWWLSQPTTGKAPKYMYDLLHYWSDEVPNGATLDGTSSGTSKLVEHYNGMGSTSADGMLAAERLIGWVPGRGAAVYGLVHPVPFPSTVTHYASTGAAWERSVSMVDATYGGEYAMMWAPRTSFKPGITHQDTWFGGPIGARVSPLNKVSNGNPPPTREGDWIYLNSMGAWTDAAGHISQSDVWSWPSEYSGKIYEDGELIYDAPASAYLSERLSPGAHHLKVVTETHRENAFWKLSTAVKTSWEFDTDTPAGQYAVLPMLGSSYQMPGLSSTDTAPRGGYDFGVKFSMPNGVKTRPIVDSSIEISWDGGQTWAPAKVTGSSDTVVNLHVRNHHGGHASLRVSATDAKGRTVSQEITNAYTVK